MTVDFDRLVNGPCMRVFGETVRYTAGLVTFDLVGVFDNAWSQVKLRSGRSGALPVSTTDPRFTVQDTAFPDGVRPIKGHTFERADGGAFKVTDVQPDGFGVTQLDLIKTN